ncbi:NADPH-dependent F420 reductase [Micromonospora sp. CPCC 205561]|uniref:NADPH-dependent F420 reductase n=1 Tax=Micromonospora sp. CPCC 205561 TaxID=3122407 RepID=UPI002FF43DFF
MSGSCRRSSFQCHVELLPDGRSRLPSVLRVVPELKEIMVNVGILGTGNLATALGRAWAGAGHVIVLTGRDPENASRAATEVGGTAQAVAPADFAARVEVVVVAVAWEGLAEALSLVGGADGALSGMTVIDCTNAVEFATGRLKPTSGSAAELVARVARGAHVVKAFHLFAGASWPYAGPRDSAPVVAICGDQPEALERAGALTGDLGARTAVVGDLSSARQLEEAAGFVMRVVAAGYNPRLAVPDVDPASPSA